ncbi:unnamed protein product [Durusdinium trenchii]|uniref:D-aminoacyl-tRNA deacylase n=1 Tax=Durusdinium trenchii TaxID=1381693 RepID=A0ABP0PYG2_9DINO
MVFFSASCRMAGLRVRGYRQAASAAEIMSAAEIKRKLAIAIETDPREVLKKEVVKDPVLKAPLREGPRLRWGRGSSRSRARAEREAREATAMQRMQQSIGNSPIGLYPVYDIPRNVASSFVGTKVLQPASLRYALAQALETVARYVLHPGPARKVRKLQGFYPLASTKKIPQTALDLTAFTQNEACVASIASPNSTQRRTQSTQRQPKRACPVPNWGRIFTMSDLLVKPLPERVARLEKARDSMKPLENTFQFANNCETVFREFRISCVHLRREREALDSLEEKDVAWRFLCKLCRERPFLHDRVHEVLQILMMSEVWMKAFAEDPECQVEDLPPEMQSEFKRRAEQALDPNAKDDGYPPRKSSHQEFKASGTIAVVVQRCLKARLLVDEAADSWAEIGRGLFVAVSFTKSATEEKLGPAARFLLTAKLSRGESSEEAESVVTLCQKEYQGILVLPQASLVSDLKDTDVRYSQQLGKSRSHVLYDHFVQTLHAAAAELSEGRGPQILAGAFDGPQVMEMSSAGPFMHSFSV